LDAEYKLKERGMIRAAMNRLIVLRDHALHSPLRERILPDGSARLKLAKNAWGKTVGRIAFLRT
jgi:hypothetical protein